MKTRIFALAIAGMLALPALLSAQGAQQHGHMGQGMAPQGRMMNEGWEGPMMGMGMAMWLQPGPAFLLGQKDALKLGDDQVQQLEQLKTELSNARETHVDKVTSLRQQVREALSGEQPDLDKYQSALQSLANEYVAMQLERARYSQKALAVLNDTQRSYVRFGMQMMHQMGENMWQYGQMMMQGGMTQSGMMRGGMMQGGMAHSRGKGGN
jgi:hypothetical protein